MKPIRHNPLHSIVNRHWMVSLLSLTGLVLGVSLILSHWQVVSGSPLPNLAALVNNSDEEIIQNLRASLQNNQLSADDRDNLQKKLAIVEGVAARPAPQSLSAMPVKILPTVAVPTISAPQPQALSADSADEKIIPGSEGMVRSSEASVDNLWQGERNGVFYQVIAGAAADDSTQGWIMVAESHPSLNQHSHRVYLPAAKTGSLHILAVQGTQVQFSDAAGSKLSFDLLTHAFQN